MFTMTVSDATRCMSRYVPGVKSSKESIAAIGDALARRNHEISRENARFLSHRGVFAGKTASQLEPPASHHQLLRTAGSPMDRTFEKGMNVP